MMLRFLLWLSIGAVIIGSLGCSSPVEKSEKPGYEEFHGIKWGTRIEKTQALKFRKELGPLKYYEKPLAPDEGKIIDRITYIFIQDRFAGAEISCHGQQNSRLIETLMEGMFGEPSMKPSPYDEVEYAWSWGSGKQDPYVHDILASMITNTKDLVTTATIQHRAMREGFK